jgi:hypothetical protein
MELVTRPRPPTTDTRFVAGICSCGGLGIAPRMCVEHPSWYTYTPFTI